MFELNVASRAKTIMGDFFGSKRKIQCLSGDSYASGVCKKSTADMTSTNYADICKSDATNTSTKKGHIKTCLSIIRIQSTDHKKEIGLYTQYASISSKDRYKFGFYGEHTEIFANNFIGLVFI